MEQKQEPEQYEEQTNESFIRRVAPLLLLLVLLIAIIGFLIGWLLLPRTSAGLRITPAFSNNIQEEQEMLSDQVEKSRITVSLIPNPFWDEATHELSLNFVVAPDNNGFSERFVIQQVGQTVYESDRIMPGYALPTIEIPDLEFGPATATVFAVDENGHDYGNPVSVELMIRAKDPDLVSAGFDE